MTGITTKGIPTELILPLMKVRPRFRPLFLELTVEVRSAELVSPLPGSYVDFDVGLIASRIQVADTNRGIIDFIVSSGRGDKASQMWTLAILAWEVHSIHLQPRKAREQNGVWVLVFGKAERIRQGLKRVRAGD